MLKLIGREDFARKLFVVVVACEYFHAIDSTVRSISLARFDLNLQIVVTLGAVL